MMASPTDGLLLYDSSIRSMLTMTLVRRPGIVLLIDGNIHHWSDEKLQGTLRE
jgi:hypothetical protein